MESKEFIKGIYTGIKYCNKILASHKKHKIRSIVLPTKEQILRVLKK